MKATQGHGNVIGKADSVMAHTARTVTAPSSEAFVRSEGPRPALYEAPSEFSQEHGRSRILLSQLPQGHTAASLD